MDIKPYHPADMVPGAIFPGWMEHSAKVAQLDVSFTDECRRKIETYTPELEFFESVEEVVGVIQDTVSQDPRTIHSKSKHGEGGCYGFQLDRLDVTFIVEKGSSTVLDVVFWPKEKESERRPLRTAVWLAGVKEKFPSFFTSSDANDE